MNCKVLFEFWFFYEGHTVKRYNVAGGESDKDFPSPSIPLPKVLDLGNKLLQYVLHLIDRIQTYGYRLRMQIGKNRGVD